MRLSLFSESIRLTRVESYLIKLFNIKEENEPPARLLKVAVYKPLLMEMDFSVRIRAEKVLSLFWAIS